MLQKLATELTDHAICSFNTKLKLPTYLLVTNTNPDVRSSVQPQENLTK